MPMITRRRQHQSSPPTTTTETTTPVTSSNTITTITPDENFPPNNNDDNDDTNDDYASNFIKDGSYQDYINAKRARNMEMLKKSGLLEAMEGMRAQNKRSTKTRVDVENERGLKRAKTKDKKESLVRRKSSRIAGVKAEDHFVTGEKAGRITTNINGETTIESYTPTYYGGRINNGSDLSLKDAVELSGSKWVKEDTVTETTKFINELSSSINSDTKKEKPPTTPKNTTSHLISQINNLTISDATTSIAKVVPERIYAITPHPSPNRLLIAAGDKSGHVGLWDVSSSSSHLFKIHTSPVNHLEWDREGRHLLSVSYDGTVREFDVEREVFRQVLATYDDSEVYKKECGFDCDDGYVQYGCRDKCHEKGLFLTTSRGVVLHVDSRRKCLSKYDVSQNKVNSLSQHPVDFNVIATAGLDTTVQLWDLRKSLKPLGVQQSSRSVNAAFFSPSGKYLLATTMADTLTLTENAHRQTGTIIRPFKTVRHDNRTGRWLTTFMAQWHPREDIFVVGSMKQPRRIDLFGAGGELIRGVEGEAMTSVYSRCCFWGSGERLVVFGGNSSGRVCVLKSDKFCL